MNLTEKEAERAVHAGAARLVGQLAPSRSKQARGVNRAFDRLLEVAVTGVA